MNRQHSTRVLVIVSGLPGSGKTTVAVPLAGSLGMPLLAKDRIKETLADSMAEVTSTDVMYWGVHVVGASLWVITASDHDANLTEQLPRDSMNPDNTATWLVSPPDPHGSMGFVATIMPSGTVWVASAKLLCGYSQGDSCPPFCWWGCACGGESVCVVVAS